MSGRGGMYTGPNGQQLYGDGKEVKKYGWTKNISRSDIQVGDFCKATVFCRGNPREVMIRNCTILEIIGDIVRVELSTGDKRAVKRGDVLTAWGYR
jgi:hypothetical protein